MTDQLENISLDEWLKGLKNYQAESIRELITKYGEEEAISKWFSAQGPSDNSPFGGSSNNNSTSFFAKFNVEFKKFICGHPDYEKERSTLQSESPIVKNVFISVISASLGANLGITATLLAPPVAIMLWTIGKVGVKAYCTSNN